MRALVALALACVTLVGCGDEFFPPELPDLYKPPYDFGAPGREGGAAPADLAIPDLGEALHDLADPIKKDLSGVNVVDLANPDAK